MNILLANYYGIEKGGSQKSTYQLGAALIERGHKVFIASTGGYNDVPVKNFGKFPLPLPSIQKGQLTPVLKKIIEKEKIEIVNPQDRMTSFAGVKAAKETGTASVVHFRDYWFACTNSTCLTKKLEPWTGEFYDFVNSFSPHRVPWEIMKAREIEKNIPLLKEANKKVAISHAVKQKLEPFGMHDAVVVPNFVEQPDVKVPEEEIRRRHSLRGKVVLFIGRFSYEKGIPVLLKAAGKVLAKRNDVTFLLAGSGPLENEMRTLAKNENIKFAGNIRFDEIGSYYNVADFVVVPSFMEAFGRTAVEAFAMRKPVIAAGIGGLRDIVDMNENGLLYSVRDFDRLAESMNVLLDDEKKCRKFGENGYRKYIEKFSKEVVIEKIEKLYEEALE
jgi:glycosyltransferase involved in cell wall biosynthesis